MPDLEMVALTALPRELTALTGGGVVPTYRQLWNMTVDGRLSAVQKVGGKYQVRRADLPSVLAILGLSLKAPAAKSARKPHQAAVAA